MKFSRNDGGGVGGGGIRMREMAQLRRAHAGNPTRETHKIATYAGIILFKVLYKTIKLRGGKRSKMIVRHFYSFKSNEKDFPKCYSNEMMMQVTR